MGVETKKMANSIASAGENFGDRLKSWPERIKTFYNDVRTEMRKVTAPSCKEVRATTAVVIITVFIFGVYFFIIDNVIQQGRQHAVQLFRGTTKSRSRPELNLIMQDEEKNEAAPSVEQPSGDGCRRCGGRTASQPEHEVVHHPLLFGV